MQLTSRDGIACDHCGASYKTDFTYFSFDTREISVFSSRKPSLDHIIHSEITSSLDICQQCFSQLKKIVVSNYQSAMVSDVRKRGKNNICICELCSDKMVGANYDFYYVIVTQVKVTMTGQPNICSNCQTKTYENDKPCNSCEGTDFVKLAHTETIDRLLEINVCHKCYNNMVNKAELIRKKASEWTTES
jgi:hypothetical protein